MADYSPTVDDLAAEMPARLQGELSLQSTFNDETRPTAAQATAQLVVAETIVTAKLGTAITDSLAEATKQAIVLKAAALVELKYYPEQANDDNSAYSLYQDQYVELRDALIAALEDDQPNQARLMSVPTFGREGLPVDP